MAGSSKLSRVDKDNLAAAFGHYLHVGIVNTSILHITPEQNTIFFTPLYILSINAALFLAVLIAQIASPQTRPRGGVKILFSKCTG